MIKLIKLISVLFASLCILTVSAQQLPINIESLTDQQLIQLIGQYQLAGLSEVELEAKAREKGLSTDQILILKKRIALLDLSSPGLSTSGNALSSSSKTETYTDRNKTYIKSPRRRDSLGGLQLYGADIFDNENLTFEPNISIATPANYIIGVNDQLVIDIFGLSDNTKKLKVTPEGYIRFPLYGPIKVAGLTIEEAEEKIKKNLTKIYPGIATGKTSIQVSLGQIRSIHITMLGEVKTPGNYTLSSLSTLMNALYASGGPNEIGSFRNIELVRNGKQQVSFDLYDLLLRGDLSKNLLLQDQDVIRIPPYKKRVAMKGAVKKAAIFDVREGETAADILQYAGGFADMGYKQFIRVTRLGVNNKELLSVKADQLNHFQLVSGDTLTIDTLANIFVNRVSVTGAVYYPGSYGINELPTLKDLLLAAKPTEGAYRTRGVIKRRQKDFTPGIINFNIDNVLDNTNNPTLQREDSVYIFSINDIREKYTVSIHGEVNKEGTYNYLDNMSIQDLVLMANGYKDGAAIQKIEVARRLRQQVSGKDTAVYAIIKDIDLSKEQLNPNDLDYKLSPFDEVIVRRSSVYKEQINVTIEGEVLYPGKYALSGNAERLSDLVRRAGGLKQNAFSEGAVLIRNTYSGKTDADKALFNSKVNLINTQSRRNVSLGEDTSQLKNSINTLYDEQKPVGLQLTEALSKPGSKQDIILEEGDVLKVPKFIETVQTFGAVNVPKQLIYTEGLTLKDAIEASGGFAANASKRHTYVVYANGEVGSTKRFLFFKSYPALKRGAEVFVPAKREAKRLTTGEIIGLSTTLVSMAGLIIALLK
jgi:protein involved in polysaccharide export with SLBB domain